jgi:hypothetical protein
MLKRTEIIALTRGATRRVMAKQVALFPPTDRDMQRLAQLKRQKATKKKAERVYHRELTKA